MAVVNSFVYVKTLNILSLYCFLFGFFGEKLCCRYKLDKKKKEKEILKIKTEMLK